MENSFNNCFDSIENFYSGITTDENRDMVGICRAWLYIGNRNFEEAKIIFDSIVCPPDSLSTGLYNIAGTIIDASLYEKFNPDNIADENIKTFIKDTYSDMLDKSGSPDDFRLGISKIFSYSVSFYSGKNQMYFLPHKLKRTASIEQSKIFDWIKTDIETAVEMCIKQNYPVICMNYPVIPPPNSEEISFWADSVGNIWKETSLKYNLLFVDNDSVFKSEGDRQNLYFEPHATGSEHCSDKGYGLIAENIAKLLIREKIME